MKKYFIFISSILLLIFLLSFTAIAKQTNKTSEGYKQREKIYLGNYRITFYCSCASCCGQWAGGPTASGVYPTACYTCACGDEISFGTELYIEGLGVYVCEDRGVSNGCVDIYVNDHSEIPSWGLDYLDVYELKEKEKKN